MITTDIERNGVRLTVQVPEGKDEAMAVAIARRGRPPHNLEGLAPTDRAKDMATPKPAKRSPGRG